MHRSAFQGEIYWSMIRSNCARFTNFITTAVKICKQCLQTASASNSVWPFSAAGTTLAIKKLLKTFRCKTDGLWHFLLNNIFLRPRYLYLHKKNEAWFTAPVVRSLNNGLSVDAVLLSVPAAALKTTFIHSWTELMCVPWCSIVCLYIVCLLLWAKLPEISKHDDECKTYLSIISRCVCDIFKLGWFLYAKSINNVCMLLLFLGDFFHRSISWAYLAPYVTAGLQSSRPPRLQAVKRKCMAPPKSGRVRAWWPLTFRTK